jgi:hypothetical protein
MMIVVPPGRGREALPAPDAPRAAPSVPPAASTAAAERIAELEATVARMTAELQQGRAGPGDPAPPTGTGTTDPPTTEGKKNAEAPARTPQELLAELSRALEAGDKGAIWNASVALYGAMSRSPEATLAEILAALAASPSLALQKQLSTLLTHNKITLDEEQARIVRDALLDLALGAEESDSQTMALDSLGALLRRYPNEIALEPDDVRSLASVMSSPGDTQVRRSAMELLGRHLAGDARLQDDLRSIARSEPDPDLRVLALRTLRSNQDDAATDLFLEVLRRDSEPAVLWEAASAANFLTQSAASTGSFKDAYRELIHRDVSDLARGRAAQSLALLATLDGDASVPADLRHLAATTSDALLAEFARTAASQLESGEASIRSLGEAWQRWHETLDRKRFP